MRSDELNRCRVCGLWLDEAPWGSDGKSPTYNYCPCCRVEFGYGDATPEAARKWREKWRAGGTKWDDPEMKPDDWSLDVQLEHIPAGFA